MQHYRFSLLLSLIILLALALSACAVPNDPAPLETQPAAQPAVTEPAASPTSAPSAVPPATATSGPSPAPSGELPAVCPPGEPVSWQTLRLALVDGGNLFVYDSVSGEALQVTAEGDVTVARLSPDGYRLAFMRRLPDGNYQLWVANGDGSQPRPVVGGEALSGMLILHEYSPSQRYLAVTQELPDGAYLYVVDFESPEPGLRRLLTPADLFPRVIEPLADYGLLSSLTWMPGSHLITFDAFPGFTQGGLYIYVQTQVFTVDADSGVIATLLPHGQGGLVSYSPDNAILLAARPDGLTALRLADMQPVSLDAPFRGVGMGEFYFFPEIAWQLPAPENPLDGMPEDDTPVEPALLIAQPASVDHLLQSEPVEIWRVPLDGSAAELLATFNGETISFDISPDRAYAAYWKAIPPSNQRSLYLGSLANGASSLVIEALLAEFQGWAPDSAHFLFVVGDAEARQLYLGSPCAAPLLVEGVQGAFAVQWLDASRFLVQEFFPQGGLRLSLGSLDGALTVLRELADPLFWDAARLPGEG